MERRIRQTKRCPHCGCVYESNVYTEASAKDKMIKFGKIYVTCPRCQRVFRDSDIYELAIMDPPAEYMSRFTVTSLILAAVLAVLALITACYSNLYTTALCLSGALFFILKDVFRHWSHLNTVKEERKRSIERIKHDPEYAMMLKAGGFRLPDGVEITWPSTSGFGANKREVTNNDLNNQMGR